MHCKCKMHPAEQTEEAATEHPDKDKQNADPESAELTRVPDVTAGELSSDECRNPAPKQTHILSFSFLKPETAKPQTELPDLGAASAPCWEWLDLTHREHT